MLGEKLSLSINIPTNNAVEIPLMHLFNFSICIQIFQIEITNDINARVLENAFPVIKWGYCGTQFFLLMIVRL